MHFQWKGAPSRFSSDIDGLPYRRFHINIGKLRKLAPRCYSLFHSRPIEEPLHSTIQVELLYGVQKIIATTNFTSYDEQAWTKHYHSLFFTDFTLAYIAFRVCPTLVGLWISICSLRFYRKGLSWKRSIILPDRGMIILSILFLAKLT